jgi:hypothetical protein
MSAIGLHKQPKSEAANEKKCHVLADYLHLFLFVKIMERFPKTMSI